MFYFWKQQNCLCCCSDSEYV